MNGSLHVQRAGAQMLVVDRGRFGYRHEGLAWCGAADALAHDVANALLCNDPQAATIEMLLGGASVRFEQRTAFALTGADCGATIDGERAPSWSVRVAEAGSVLELRAPARGMFAYLAVAGGIDVPVVLGSRTTDRAAGIGGYEARALRAGDRLSSASTRTRGTPSPFAIEPPQPRGHVRVIEGGEIDGFDAASREALFSDDWRVGHESNRMGYRMHGRALRFHGAELPSHGVFPGVIQVPPSGEPIVLLADAHATGGYPKAGVVIDADLRTIAQSRPGESLRFCRSDAGEAATARARRHAYLQALTALAVERWSQ